MTLEIKTCRACNKVGYLSQHFQHWKVYRKGMKLSLKGYTRVWGYCPDCEWLNYFIQEKLNNEIEPRR